MRSGIDATIVNSSGLVFGREPMVKYFIVVAIVFISACSNWERVEINGRNPAPYGVSPGALCNIETLNGQSYIFRVLTISDSSFIGEETEVQFDDIKKLQIQEDSDTVAWTVMGTGVALPFILPVLIIFAVFGG
jgi:hypothetical protein